MRLATFTSAAIPTTTSGAGASDGIWRIVENSVANLTLDQTGDLAVRARFTCNDLMNNNGAFYVGGGTNNYMARSLC